MISLQSLLQKGIKGGILSKYGQGIYKLNSTSMLSSYQFSNNNTTESETTKQNDAQPKQEIQRSSIDELKQKTMNQLMEIKNQQISDAKKSRKEYRDAVLFEEILNTQKEIPLYDCFGKVYRHELIKNVIFILGGLGIFYYFYQDPDTKRKRKMFNCGLTAAFIATRFLTYRRFQKSFVDKVIYDTTTKLVSLSKKTFYGRTYETKVNPGILLFTNDKTLNKKNINYINIETLETYQIGYDYAWKNKALFSHVLEQRVETIRHKKN